MLKLLPIAGLAVMLMGAAPAPMIPAAPTPLLEQSTLVMDDCYDACVISCWKWTGDWGYCENSCVSHVCPAGAAPQPKDDLWKRHRNKE